MSKTVQEIMSKTLQEILSPSLLSQVMESTRVKQSPKYRLWRRDMEVVNGGAEAGCNKNCPGKDRCVVGHHDGSCGAKPRGEKFPDRYADVKALADQGGAEGEAGNGTVR